jgi:hypothetical protein
MKLAEALVRRADLQRRLVQLKSRAVDSARIQEGDNAEEDPTALLEEFDRVSADLEELIARINLQNLNTEVTAGLTITAALAHRDSLNQRHAMRVDLADAATRRADRQTRSEIKFVATISVRDLRKQIDDIAVEIRELDNRIQQTNWTTELE